MSVTPFAPSSGDAPSSAPQPGGSPLAGGGAGGGQGVQILQQVQSLLAQLLQVEQQPAVQQAVNAMLKLVDPLMQAVGASDQQSMNSGLANPTGNSPEETSVPAGPDNMGQSESAESQPPSKSFSGAKKAAMANFNSKGHFSKSGSKGEQLQTDKTKNRTKGK